MRSRGTSSFGEIGIAKAHTPIVGMTKNQIIKHQIASSPDILYAFCNAACGY